MADQPQNLQQPADKPFEPLEQYENMDKALVHSGAKLKKARKRSDFWSFILVYFGVFLTVCYKCASVNIIINYFAIGINPRTFRPYCNNNNVNFYMLQNSNFNNTLHLITRIVCGHFRSRRYYCFNVNMDELVALLR